MYKCINGVQSAKSTESIKTRCAKSYGFWSIHIIASFKWSVLKPIRWLFSLDCNGWDHTQVSGSLRFNVLLHIFSVIWRGRSPERVCKVPLCCMTNFLYTVPSLRGLTVGIRAIFLIHVNQLLHFSSELNAMLGSSNFLPKVTQPRIDTGSTILQQKLGRLSCNLAVLWHWANTWASLCIYCYANPWGPWSSKILCFKDTISLCLGRTVFQYHSFCETLKSADWPNADLFPNSN